MTAPILEARGLSKRFGATQALDAVDIDVRPGEVHSVLGENGSGKTTLMNLLFGLLPPTAGRIVWHGREVALRGPAHARTLGIAMVHQHFMLVNALRVWENVALGDPDAARFRLDAARGRRRVAELGDRLRLALDPDAVVGDLPVGARQRVEIAKALTRSVSLLILDEPTAVLAPSEVNDLLAIVRRLESEGTAVLFVSHKLDEVLAVSDRITVLRRGQVVDRCDVAEADVARLSRAIVGEASAREVASPSVRAAPSAAASTAALSVRDLSRSDGRRVAVESVTCDVSAGEILGIAGVDGNGQDELVALLAGLARPERGSIRLDGEEIGPLGAAARWRRGLSVIPGDRGRDGLVLDARVWENLALREFGAPWARGRFGVRPSAHRNRARDLLARFDVRGAGPETSARVLSGGNQQKLLLARELARAPRALILVNPTRGLDVGATLATLDLVRRLRDGGTAILLISTELDELLSVSDRIAVLFRGRLTESGRDRADIGARMLGSRA